MRVQLRATVPLCLTVALMGCNETAPAPTPVEAAPVTLEAGQWSFTRKTTGYNTPTVTPAEYQAALKKVDEEKLCLAVDDQGVPDADALAGPEGSDCTYKDRILRKGRLIATLSCKAGKGMSDIIVEGNFTGDSMTLGTTMTKTVGGKAVLRTTHDLTGRRLGNCA